MGSEELVHDTNRAWNGREGKRAHRPGDEKGFVNRHVSEAHAQRGACERAKEGRGEILPHSRPAAGGRG